MKPTHLHYLTSIKPSWHCNLALQWYKQTRTVAANSRAAPQNGTAWTDDVKLCGCSWSVSVCFVRFMHTALMQDYCWWLYGTCHPAPHPPLLYCTVSGGQCTDKREGARGIIQITKRLHFVRLSVREFTSVRRFSGWGCLLPCGGNWLVWSLLCLYSALFAWPLTAQFAQCPRVAPDTERERDTSPNPCLIRSFRTQFFHVLDYGNVKVFGFQNLCTPWIF